MKRTLVSIIFLLTISISTFGNKIPKHILKLSGKWELIEIQKTTYFPDGKYHKTKQTTNYQGNIKEYFSKDLTFKKYVSLNKLVLEGTWALAEDKIVETVNYDSNKKLSGVLNAYDYQINKNIFNIKYNVGSKNNVFIKETWKKLR